MRRLVLEIQKGGLGDHLFYSHIPRIAKETKAFDEVFISLRSIFRHPDYKKMIWGLNPYIDGFTEEKGIFLYPEEIEMREGENLLDKIMLLYGLEDGLRFHEPELYYQPLQKTAWQDLVIYDPNFVSYVGDLSNSHLIEKWLQERAIKIDYQMKKLGQKSLRLSNMPIIETDSLEDFCSLIISCKTMYCLTTGTATLAAALQKPVVAFHGSGQMKRYHHSKIHRYIDLGSDYTFKNTFKKCITVFIKKFISYGTR